MTRSLSDTLRYQEQETLALEEQQLRKWQREDEVLPRQLFKFLSHRESSAFAVLVTILLIWKIYEYLILSCGILFSLYILQDLQLLRDETARSAANQEAEQRFDTYLLCIHNVYVPVSVLI